MGYGPGAHLSMVNAVTTPMASTLRRLAKSSFTTLRSPTGLLPSLKRTPKARRSLQSLLSMLKRSVVEITMLSSLTTATEHFLGALEVMDVWVIPKQATKWFPDSSNFWMDPGEELGVWCAEVSSTW